MCDATYGLSIGRGSFHFAAGDWTHVSQTVRLNTPGKQDGGFELVVNDQRIMRRDDVFYRDEPSSSNGNAGGDGDGDSSGSGGDSDGGWSGDGDGDDSGNGSGTDDGNDDGGLLGDLLRREWEGVDSDLSPVLLSGYASAAAESRNPQLQAPLFAPEAVPDALGETVPIQKNSQGPPPSVSSGIKTETSTATVTTTQSAPCETSTALGCTSQVQVESQGDQSGGIGFSGIFFR